MKTFLAKDDPDFKLKITVGDCVSPVGLKHLVFIREQYDEQGKLTQESSYNFFLTSEQVRALGKNLQHVVD